MLNNRKASLVPEAAVDREMTHSSFTSDSSLGDDGNLDQMHHKDAPIIKLDKEVYSNFKFKKVKLDQLKYFKRLGKLQAPKNKKEGEAHFSDEDS